MTKQFNANILQGDCLEIMRGMETGSVDLVFCSPPYESARSYGIDFNLKGQAWVDWAVQRYVECVRICRGLVAWVVEGQTRNFRYKGTPALLMADLHRADIRLRKPPIYKRVGIPGSGGPDWWRNDYEWIICAGPGKLPWSDNTAMGHPPKWAAIRRIAWPMAGGFTSYTQRLIEMASGSRVTIPLPRRIQAMWWNVRLGAGAWGAN